MQTPARARPASRSSSAPVLLALVLGASAGCGSLLCPATDGTSDGYVFCGMPGQLAAAAIAARS